MKSKSEKASRVTEDFILEKFVDLMDDTDASWTTKVKGLELLGKYLNMFQDQKKVDINIHSLIAGASLEELQRLAGEGYGESSEVDRAHPERYLGMHSTAGDRRIRADGEGDEGSDAGKHEKNRRTAKEPDDEG